MKESLTPSSIEEEQDNFLEEAALDVGLKADIPSYGSAAYKRLEAVCNDYTRSVLLQSNSISEKTRSSSDKNRRSFHNKLCVMLLGTTWHETDSDDRKKISNFAVTVGGRKEFVGTF